MVQEFDSFRKYLSGFMEVPVLEWAFLITKLRLRNVKKNEAYYSQGENVSEIGFVVRGLFYNYYLDAKGKEHVKSFISEANPVAAYSSLILDVPANYSSRAIENSTIITLQYKDLKNLYERHKCWERMGRISAEKIFIDKEIRENEFLLLDANDRYEIFKKNNSKILNRVPQYLIASYLGISEVSLSRLRKSI